MRLTLLLVTATSTALVSMALFGASIVPAESTVLCKVDTNLVCPTSPTNQTYTGHIEGKSSSAMFSTSFGNVHCASSTILGNILGLANPVVGHNELIDFPFCSELTFGTGCTVTTEELGLLLLLKTGFDLGEVKFDNMKIRLNCASVGLNCVYTKPVFALHTVGANLALGLGSTSLGKITAIIDTLENAGGGFCPAISKLTATYFIQLPHEIFITE